MGEIGLVKQFSNMGSVLVTPCMECTITYVILKFEAVLICHFIHDVLLLCVI